MKNKLQKLHKEEIRAFLFALILFPFSIQAQTALGPWNPVLYPAVTGTPGWEVQDNAAAGTVADPFASWSAVVDAIEAGGTNQTITILPDAFIESYDYDNDGSAESTLGHNLATELNITSTQNGLMINGSVEGCYTLFDNTANGSGSLFGTIAGADNITVKGLYLLNGYAGAFNITGSTNITFEDCIFDNNDLNGVEVFNITAGASGSGVTFTRCKFINNNNNGIVHNITRNSGNGVLNLTFTDCTWSCNSSTSGGAAMKVTNGDTGGINMDFSGCTFAGNTSAGAQGGAIWFDGSETTATFTNTDFINNQLTGGTGGGALFIGTNDNVTMTGCNFYGNNTTNISADGGAIYAFSGSSGTATLNISNATFDGNISVDDGAAICMRYADVTLDNIHVVNNSAGDGIITTANSAANCTVSNVTCGTNTAPDGCLYQRAGTLTDNGGTASGSPVDLSAIASTYTCGSYCALTLPGTCTAVSRGNAICAAVGSVDISGQVWEDINGNGIQEAGDNGLAGAFVLLYDANGNLVGRTNSDGSGNYSFSSLPSGSYYVVFVNPDLTAHPNVAPPNTGTESTDSDIINSTTNQTDNINATTADVDGAFTSVVLPVNLISFSGESQDETIILEWWTASEINNEGFFLERFNENSGWQTLSFTAGKGDSEERLYYSSVDESPLNGMNKYRLKQVDFDGKSAYSEVLNIRYIDSSTDIHFYPNPTSSLLFLDESNFSSNQVILEIFDFSGKQTKAILLRDDSVQLSAYSVDVSALKTGIYFLKMTSSDGKILTGRMIKN